MTDPFANYQPTIDGPATGGMAVNAETEDVDLPQPSRALWVGNDVLTDVKVTMLDGQVLTFRDLGPGLYPFRVTKVWTTEGSNRNVVAVW